jgi:ribosomal protein L11 methyltransferase
VIFVARIPVGAERADLVLAELMDTRFDGLVEGDEQFDVHFRDRAQAEECARRHSGEVVEVEDRNWAAEWQAGWSPMPVGRRFHLAPAWCSDPTPPGRIRLEMRPGLVFGGGDHATTRFCLELLEDAVRPGCVFADIGSGSGILALAARALGASVAVGCDLWRDAAEETLRVSVPSWEGSVDALGSRSVDVLAANLPTGVLLTLMPEFERVLRRGGRMVLSGYLVDQREMVVDAAPWRVPRIERQDEDWAAALFVAG